MAGFIDILRSGAWLTAQRVRLVALAVLAASLIGIAFLAAGSDGLNDRFGRPLGTDFSNVYAAGTYVLDGNAAAPFDPIRQHAREQAIFGQATPFYGWHYPPFFLGLAALLATMPYWLALLVWQGATLALYIFAIRAILLIPPPLAGEGGQRSWPGGGASTDDDLAPPGARSLSSGRPSAGPVGAPPSPFRGGMKKAWLLLALAFPAVFINLGHGHNGFLTAALFAGGLLMLVERPILAGVLFGLLAYKPQFGMLIPLVLIAGGHWRAFAAAALTVTLLALAVTFAFGLDVWTAFLASTGFTRTVVLEQGGTGWYKIQSVFAWVRLWGGPVPLAYVVQGAVTLAISVSLVWLWRSRAAFPLKAAALLIGTVLATPYSLDYDLMLLAPAIAFIAADGMCRGFAPWQKTLLAALWIVPLVTRSVAETALIPLAVPLMLMTFVFVLHCAMTETGARKAFGVFRFGP